MCIRKNVISESVQSHPLSALRFYTRAAAWQNGQPNIELGLKQKDIKQSACLNIYLKYIYTHAFVYAGKTKEIHVEHNLSEKTYINMMRV